MNSNRNGNSNRGGGELRKFVAPEFIFGIDALHLVGQYARNLGMSRVLLVTDPGVREAGWAELVEGDLEAAGLDTVVFDGVTPNPKDHEVDAGLELYRAEGCNALVSVGGGSPMDCAKGIGIVSSNGSSIHAYEGVDEVPAPCPPLICIPTTAGTSADVSQFCIITHSEKKYKMAIISKAVVPDVSLIDPMTTTTMDGELTANTGLDALTHAVEALASNASSPITDLHGLDAVRLITKHFEAVLNDLDSIEHRVGMMLASLQAGLAFSNASLGAVHAMAHALGGRLDLAHGECNAILLPHVIELNGEAARDKYAAVAQAMGISPDVAKGPEWLPVLLDEVRRLQRIGGSDTPLSVIGVEKEDIPLLAATAMRDACLVTNPKPVTQSEIEQTYARAL